MKMQLNIQSTLDATLPPLPVRTFSGSALPLEIAGVPSAWCGGRVTSVSVTVTNADGMSVTGLASLAGGQWRILFAASNFAHFGFVSKGVRVDVTVTFPDSTSSVVTLGVADFEVVAATPSATPGTPPESYQRKGDDEFFKSYVANGVQHYVKQVVSYDAQIGWGADWTGDYILVGGEFVEFTEE